MSTKKSEETMLFGVHLTLDGYGGDPARLNNRDIVYRCLDEMPGMLGMKKLLYPVVVEAPVAGAKDSGGFSGFVIIATSHISVHTFPFRHFVSIDLYTCKEDELNEEKRKMVINYFKQAFALKDTEINFIKRGTKFPIRDF